MHKAYNFRLYPTKKQQAAINKIIGSCRYVFNYYLNKKIEIYKTERKNFTYNQCAADLKELKKQLPWLKEADSIAVQQSLRDLDTSYKNFFRHGAGFPNFKSKRNKKQAYRTQMVNNNIKLTGNTLVLPKIGAVSFVKSREIAGSITSVTVKKTASGKYFVSILTEMPETVPLPATSQVIGIDLGLKDYVTLSTGEVIGNPKELIKAEKKLKKLQRNLSKKQQGSNNREKARKKLAVQHEKVANARKDFQHKLSTRLIHENQVICLETLYVKAMMQDGKKAKAIGDAGWSSFKNMLLYKARWYCRTVHCINAYYPSSQLCSVCGHQNPKVRDLSVRNWQCPKCGSHHQRDANASANILRQGLEELGNTA